MDVKTAFFDGDLDKENYMEHPPGLKTDGDEIFILNKCIYGLVQSAHQCYKKAVMILVVR